MDNKWINQKNCDIRTLYFQGIFSSQVQLAKYTGNRGFVATTGEHVRCKNAPEIIYQPYIGKELDEVNLKQCLSTKKIKLLFQWIRKIIFFSSWVQELISSAQLKKWNVFVDRCHAHTRKTVGSFSVLWKKCDFGQQKDCAEHKKRYEKCKKEHPDAGLVFYGVSRGSATTFNSAALNKYDRSRLRLFILESCFDSIPLVLNNWYPRMLSYSFLSNMFLRLCSFFTGFEKNGVSPINVLDSFPPGVPVVFISSRFDTTVPFLSVQNIAHALAGRAKNPVYFLALNHSDHPTYTIEHVEDKKIYLHFIHALYKELNLPYIEKYALAGESKGLLDAFRL